MLTKVKPSTQPSARSKGEVKKTGPRERILAAAFELFYRDGIHQVSVDSIAIAANSNKNTLYRHFGSKDGLINEYLRSHAAAFEEGWDEVLRKYQDDPKARLLAIMNLRANFYLGDGGRGCAIANAAVELAQKDHPARLLVEELKVKQLARLVKLCREAGLRKPVQVVDELFLLFEGARACVQSMGLGGPAAQLPRLVKEAIERHAR
jgi:AcrR family transcriptional regulator